MNKITDRMSVNSDRIVFQTLRIHGKCTSKRVERTNKHNSTEYKKFVVLN